MSYRVEFTTDSCLIKDQEGKTLITSGRRVGNLYELGTSHTYNHSLSHVVSDLNSTNVELWHRRMGHPSLHKLKIMYEDGLVHGLQIKSPNFEIPLCTSCLEGKQSRKKFPKWGGRRATKLLEIVHSDICGPIQTFSHGGAKYFVTFIDDFSRKCVVTFLKTKGEVLEAFKSYKTIVELQTGK